MLPFLLPSADENVLYVVSSARGRRGQGVRQPDQCPAESSAGPYASPPGGGAGWPKWSGETQTLTLKTQEGPQAL